MWRNWAGDQACEPAVLQRPASTAEVVDAVGQAVAAGRRVRVAGAGHSFTDAVLTEGSLLHLGRMTGVIDADRGSGLARVRAGTTIGALSDELAGHGLALENLGDIDAQAVAGAIATGTHGTGGRLPGLPAQVEALQLVTAAGEVVDVEGSDPSTLRAAQVAIGSLGVVTELTLRCLPAYTLRGVDAPAPLEEVLDALHAHVDGHRHFELFTFPHSPLALTRTNDVVDDAPRPRARAKAYVDDVLLANRAFGAACRLGRAVPRAIPALNRTLSRSVGTSVRVDRSDRIFASARLVRFVEMEYAVPRAAAADVLRAMKAQAERFAVGFPLELRFSAGDDTLLGPASGRDSAFVAVHVYRGMEWEPYFRAAEAIADAHGGRPHWGKRHFQTAATLAPRYPGWEAFRAVRARLDPDGVFANAYTDRILGPARPAESAPPLTPRAPARQAPTVQRTRG